MQKPLTLGLILACILLGALLGERRQRLGAWSLAALFASFFLLHAGLAQVLRAWPELIAAKPLDSLFGPE